MSLYRSCLVGVLASYSADSVLNFTPTRWINRFPGRGNAWGKQEQEGMLRTFPLLLLHSPLPRTPSIMTTAPPTEIRTDLGHVEKDFDGLSSQMSKDEGPQAFGSIDAEVAAAAARDYKAIVITREFERPCNSSVISIADMLLLLPRSGRGQEAVPHGRQASPRGHARHLRESNIHCHTIL